jgi:rhomboid protease GluP
MGMTGRESCSYEERNGETGSKSDLLNHFTWQLAHHLVREQSFFVANHDEEGLALRKSEGFLTTFIWLIPADHLSKRRMERQLDDTLTWMAAYRRKTPSLIFRSIHLYLFASSQEEAWLKTVCKLGSFGITGRYGSSSWALDVETGRLYTPNLLSPTSRKIKQVIGKALGQIYNVSSAHKPDSDLLHRQIGEWQQEIDQLERSRTEDYKKRMEYRMGAPLTFTLASVNLLIWVLMTIYGGSTNRETLIRFGAKYNEAILQGETWRLITPIFLHIGGLHLWFNSTALLSIGSQVERIFGTIRFLFIYLFAGAAGTLSSFFFSPAISAGASGAIFGLFGALLYFSIKDANVFGHTMKPGLISGLAINLLLGFLIPGIDNYAHAGGLVGGFIAATMLGLPKMKI